MEKDILLKIIERLVSYFNLNYIGSTGYINLLKLKMKLCIAKLALTIKLLKKINILAKEREFSVLVALLLNMWALG